MPNNAHEGAVRPNVTAPLRFEARVQIVAIEEIEGADQIETVVHTLASRTTPLNVERVEEQIIDMIALPF